jgi:cytochrome c-type biogenesis protein CcmH
MLKTKNREISLYAIGGMRNIGGVLEMKRLIGFICLLLFFSISNKASAEGVANERFDYTNSEFKATVDMLSMEGHGNDDLASCNVKQLYYEEVGEMFFIKEMSKKEILDYYAKEQGVQALNAPPVKGFNLSLWITPFLVLFIISILLYFVVKKWKGNRTNLTTKENPNATDLEQGIYESIIEEERKKFF